jgi:uncharacterized protein (DUF4415 family)
MGIIKSTVRVGQKVPKEVIKEIKKASRRPIVYTEDSPKSTPEALKEFAQLAVKRSQRKKKQSVTIRIAPDILESYKTMGDGYTGVMADVLKYAVNNPAVLTNAIK